VDNVPVVADRRKTLALLAYLAVNRWQHQRDHISALFWPDYDQAKAFTNLRHILWEVQQLIGDGWIQARRDTLELIPDVDPSQTHTRKEGYSVWLDVAQFRALLRESRVRAQTEVSQRISLLTDAVQLYRNHFLMGFSLKNSPPFNEWISVEAEELGRELAGALHLLSGDLCSFGQAEAAVPHAQRLVTLDPLNEALHRHLMHVYLEAGQHNAALKQYQLCERILRKELNIDPQPETRVFYRQIRKRMIKPSLPVGKAEKGAPPHNLPFQISTFIGRERELEEIVNLISRYRLVTLVGPGGIGKTRLSLRIGEQLLNEYSGGIWLVELASLNDPVRVPLSVATVFGLAEGSEGSILEKLILILRAKSNMIVLDNCEHLLDACAWLSEALLKGCPNLKILATSREPLGVMGEALYHVPSLELPDVQQVVQQLLDYEAVQLFEERARLVNEHFAVTLENASAVIQICRRLDGLPLAIELAAARVNLLSPQHIAARLNESFNLLSGGSRTAFSRHQTIRASVDWSWNLISEEEQTLLRRLAVFVGGWTLEGAEAVGADDSLHKLDVLGLLDNLIEKSLVLFSSEKERYRMLESVREYALDRLRRANEEEETRNRHLYFYVRMAETAEPELLGKAQGTWMQKLGEEQENILAAIDWCSLSESRTEQGFRLLGGTRYYWAYAGLAKLGHKIYLDALSRKKENETTLALGLTLDGIAIHAMLLGDPLLTEYAEQSLSIFHAHGDRVRLAMALSRKAWGQMILGNLEAAIRTYHEAIALGRQIEDKRPISSALNNLAEIYRMDEKYEKAAPLYEEALAIDREREDSTGIVLGLLNRSRVALMQGKLDEARAQLAEAAGIVVEAHLREYMQFIVEATAILRYARGEHLEGAQLFGAAAMELRKKGYHYEPIDDKFIVHWTEKMRDTLGEELFTQALEEGSKVSSEQAMAETREWLDVQSSGWENSPGFL
jgi:predicted ATPase/DNA-binding SARP family transcriptional activator